MCLILNLRKEIINMADKVKVLTVDGLAYYHTKVKKAIEDSEARYTNDEPIVTQLGGIKVGETFDNVPVAEMLTKLLYPYTVPTINTMTATATGGVFEKGTSVSVTAMSVIVGKKSSKLAKVEFLKAGTVVDTITAGLPTTGTATIRSTQALTINTDTTLSAKVYDSEATAGTASTNGPTYKFVDPYFYGAVQSGVEITSAVITGLNKRIENKGNKAYTYKYDDSVAVIAYPKSYGKLSKITDPNGFDITGTFGVTEMTLTVKSGDVAYYVYTNDPSSVPDFKITFAY